MILSVAACTKLFVMLPAVSGFSAHGGASTRLPSAVRASAGDPSQLEQLASVTTLSIDSGSLTTVAEYAATGLISDATTNPLFVSQAAFNGDPAYSAMVAEAVDAGVTEAREGGGDGDENLAVELATERLAVILGREISKLVDGYVSTEVDPRLSFDAAASVERARRIIRAYARAGVPRRRILIKLAATWEGIEACRELEAEGVTCNLTLIFGHAQAVACAQAGATLISPFPGRVLDWHGKAAGRPTGDDSRVEPDDDEGVAAVRRMHAYYKEHGHGTICMPASWRPSRGKGFELDEIVALAGADRMTIPAPLLERLAACRDPLPRLLQPDGEYPGRAGPEPELGGGAMSEGEFRYMMTMDGCANDKLAEGIRAFVGETIKLENAIREKVKVAMEVAV
eukprot:CAMPEP_0194277148 /NCGR_PEP_ID=MMETSP0169-20130528/9540_1 /TAXON_ID=218684 /ORGANISM="Corethron pennatum, Strain L29A3" /LENGTH=397 /DNA_ID=CAMNT_0039021041 /DNA_START=8 /DNA_END=1201 /DNA_ORIENTATION=-